MNNNCQVALQFTERKSYPEKIPFDPSDRYPEYKGENISPQNEVYEGIRNILISLQLDKDNIGTEKWNPFGDFIKPGMKVFIKPNTVTHVHEKKKDIFSVINHASVLRPILDYVCLALNGEGRIIIADSQLYFSNFDKAWEVAKFKELLRWYTAQTPIPIEMFDLRINKAYRTYLYGRWGRKTVTQDPRGYSFVDLGKNSCFSGIDPKKLRIAIASYKNMRKHHTSDKHEYQLPQSVLESDVIINIPKLKTHRRTAITIGLKNFMGIASLKDCLPHFQVGSVSEGGDQYINPSIRKKICTFLHDQIQTSPFIPVKCICAITKKIIWNSNIIKPFKDNIYEAMWPGNDTIWRTLYDLNRIVMYADKKGTVSESQKRTVFTLVDGIVGGEGNGPLTPDPVYVGALLGGFNQVAVDAVAATVMGFDINKIPLIINSFVSDNKTLPLSPGKLEDITVTQNSSKQGLSSVTKNINLRFEPHSNWKNRIERGLN